MLGLGASAYLIWIYGDIELNPFAMRGKMFWISAVLIPLMWEALRRTAGWSLTIVLSVFLAYAFVGHLAPGMLKGYEQDGYRMIAELGVTNVALLGLPLKIIVLTVVLFIWMGQLLLPYRSVGMVHRPRRRHHGAFAGRFGQDRGRRLGAVRLDIGLGGLQRRLDRP